MSNLHYNAALLSHLLQKTRGLSRAVAAFVDFRLASAVDAVDGSLRCSPLGEARVEA
jgi:hypothetical protein